MSRARRADSAGKAGARTDARTRSARRPAPALRDQDRSTFTLILDRLVRVTPGASGAALVDREGETVDYAGHIETFEIKVAAAHWQIVLTTMHSEQPLLADVRQIVVRARTRSYVVRQLPEEYAIVLVLHRHAAFAASPRALEEADARLCREAGWAVRSRPWCSVEVETDPAEKTRPRRILVEDVWHPIEVMGAMIGLRVRERGFRVRLPTGVEMMLVRERTGLWFADESIA